MTGALTLVFAVPLSPSLGEVVQDIPTHPGVKLFGSRHSKIC